MALDTTYVPNPSALRSTEPLSAPSYESIVNALFQATSPDPAVLGRATAYLSDLEAHPTFWLLLIEVAFDRNIRIDEHRINREGATPGKLISFNDVENRWNAIRTVAIIRFKNGVDKYWRSRVVNRVTITIPAETKSRLRQGLLRCLDEPNRTVALQASVAIARIARHDFPNAWSDLFTFLQGAMVEAHANMTAGGMASSGSSLDTDRLVLLRASDVCQKTLKELSTVRILAGKIRMTELSRLLLPTLVPMFQQYFEETFGDAAIDLQRWVQSPFLMQRVRTSHLLLKSVTYLAVGDMGTLTRNSSVGGIAANMAQDFFRMTPVMLQTLRDARLGYIQYTRSSASSSETKDWSESITTLSALQKHFLAFGKMYLALLNRDKSKAVTWPGWDEVVWWYWQEARSASTEELATSSKSEADANKGAVQRLPSRFIVQSLVLLKQSMQDWKTSESRPIYLKDENTIRGMVDILVEKMMLLTKSDLEIWESDAEDWSVAEEADVYDVDIRPAAERTLMVLASTSKNDHFVGRLIWSKFEQLASQSIDGDIRDVLRRDAIYAALGRCGVELPVSAEILSEVAASRLVLEGSLQNGNGHSLVIIRRRIAWLIWEWSEQIQVKDRPRLYQFLVSLLQNIPEKLDAAVRLAATRSLAALADAIEFDSDAFEPFIGDALSRLAILAAGSELHEMDSIRTCTNAMSILIERMGPRIAPHLQSLARLVPDLWMIEDVECKAKPSVIVFVGKLVRSVELLPGGSKQSGDSLHGIVEVIVRDSLQPHNLPLLGKDALELWIRSLRSSARMSDPLFRLLPLLTPLLSQPDYCPEACRIAQESTLLAPQQVMSHYGPTLLTEFASIIADPMSALILHPINAIDIIMQALSINKIQANEWAQLLDHSGLFYALLGTLIKVKDSVIVAGYYVALLARLCFMASGSSIFFDLIQSAAIRLEGPTCSLPSQVTNPMIAQWCKKFQNMASTRKRKITCLGLASLLASAEPNGNKDIYDQMPEMIGVWMDMLGDLSEDTPPPMPNAPPSSPLDLHQISSKDLMRRSPSPALSIPGLEGLDDDDEWLEDTSPGKARILELHRLDPVNTLKLSTYISGALQQAQERGGSSFQAALAQIDNVVLEIFQRDLAR